MEAKPAVPLPQKQEKERKYCNFAHIQNASAYCTVCGSYVCETCQIENHFNHDMIQLEVECLKKYSEYKKIVYDTQVTLKQYEKMAEGQSVDEVLNGITAKVASKFDELIEKILAYKEKLIKQLLDNPEVQQAIDEKKNKQDEAVQTLCGIQTEAQNLMEKVHGDLTDKHYIILYERDSLTEIGTLRKRLQEWKSRASANPLKIQQLGSDIAVEMKPSEGKLGALVKIRNYSRPPMQLLYDFNNENSKLLLFDLQKKASQTISLGLDSQIPFHFSAAMLGSKIYFVGGDDNGYRKDCYAVSYTKKTVKKLNDLNVERRNHALVALHISRVLYTAGGYNKDKGYLASVEKYVVAEGKWREIAPLPQKREWVSLCQYNSRYIYSFAGSGQEAVDRLDVNCEEKGWESVTITKASDGWGPRSACASIQISPMEILVFGGCAKKDVDDVFVFYPETRTFERRKNMPAPSLFCQMGPVIAGPLVGIMGWRNELVYIYNTVMNEWTTIDQDKYTPPDFDSK